MAIGQFHERQDGAMAYRMLLTMLVSSGKVSAPCGCEKIKALASDDTNLALK